MRVVHCRRDPYTVYIGRPSPLGNPFRLGPGCTRTQAIQQFEQYARQSAAVLAAIRALPADAVLGCWCAPRPCHGDVILQLWRESRERDPEG